MFTVFYQKTGINNAKTITTLFGKYIYIISQTNSVKKYLRILNIISKVVYQ